MTRERWIFGYGSLVWRPEFPHLERRTSWVHGFARRFWQGSTDHRGVPGAPGRVVTLAREPGARCWGVAYRVGADSVEAVLAQLDHRERGGYDRVDVELHFHGPDGPESRAPGLMYVATARNPNYLGPAPLDEIADQVAVSHGPSGANVDYVLRLAAALREICPALGAEGEGDPRETGEETLALARRVEARARAARAIEDPA
jgi:cation transport protein ChaC